MTKNEEIKKVIFGLQFLKEKLYNGIFSDRLDCIDYAISAIKEIQQYREIGTVEECREAAEKQKAEKIEYETDAVFNNGFGYYRMGKCPICDSRYNSNDEINYCSKCGKKLDWSEENE